MTAKQKSILVVDDDQQLVIVVRKVLEKAFHDFDVLSAATGTAGIEQAMSAQPEIVLLDVNMPDINGFEVCRQLRACELTRTIPVLMMTGERLESANKAAGFHLGADAYLFKPFGNSELVSQVRILLRVRETEDSLRAQQATLEEAFRAQTIELQQSKEALQQKVFELEKRLREETQSLIREDHFTQGSILAAGIAHEINNPNTFVASNLTTFERFWEVVEPVLRSRSADLPAAEAQRLEFVLGEMPGLIAGMKKGTQRIHAIIRGMKSSLAGVPAEARAISVAGLVKGAVAMTGHQLPGRIRVTVEVAETLPGIWGSENMLLQVLVNLITNAVAAIKEARDQGTITLSSDLDETGHVMIRVRDDGPGIPAELQTKLFTPFFTTRRERGGTGLGLFLSNGIIKGHQGTLAVCSAAGEGTTVTIRLPPLREASGRGAPGAAEAGTRGMT